MFCARCGFQVEGGANFCQGCGAPLPGGSARDAGGALPAWPVGAPKKKGYLWVLWVAAGAGLLVILGAAFVAWGWSLFSSQARAALNQNPVIRERIGEIREFHLNLSGTAEDSRVNVYVFDLAGPEGRGRVTATFETVDAENERLTSGVLKMSNGEEFELLKAPGGEP